MKNENNRSRLTYCCGVTFSGMSMKQRCLSMPAHSCMPTMPKMKKTKKHSRRTFPSMGRVSSRSITRILIPGGGKGDGIMLCLQAGFIVAGSRRKAWGTAMLDSHFICTFHYFSLSLVLLQKYISIHIIISSIIIITYYLYTYHHHNIPSLYLFLYILR